MHSKARFHGPILGNSWSTENATLTISVMPLFVVFVFLFLTLIAQAQNYSVIHNFTGGIDGATPYAGVTIDSAGNLYGTTFNGKVYRLTPRGASWVFATLHQFGVEQGPWARVVFGPDGGLYSSLTSVFPGYGTVFVLRPPATICPAISCPWTGTTLYTFTGQNDVYPTGDLAFDREGNIYGTSVGQGTGAAYQLQPSNGGWTENVLHTFGQPGDGVDPYGGLIMDAQGNLYGTTLAGGSGGTVFKLEYSAGSGWTETILYNFQGGNDGDYPYAGLIFDPSGNLYGTTSDGGQGHGGTVFELTRSGAGWNFSLIYSLTGSGGCGSWGPLYMDPAGNLFGTTYCDGDNGMGNIFKLSPSNGGWTYTSLKDFSSDGLDGAHPIGGVAGDSQGNLYGTTSNGGTGCRYNACGVVWEITP